MMTWDFLKNTRDTCFCSDNRLQLGIVLPGKVPAYQRDMGYEILICILVVLLYLQSHRENIFVAE